MTQRIALPARRHHITQKVRIAGLLSLLFQYGAPLEKVGDLLAGAKLAPYSPASGHDRIRSRRSLPNLIRRHRLGAHWDRNELAYIQAPPVKEDHHDFEP